MAELGVAVLERSGGGHCGEVSMRVKCVDRHMGRAIDLGCYRDQGGCYRNSC